MPNLNEDDAAMREVLANSRVIAVVGYSDRPDRPSYQIAQFLRKAGYAVYPVNPTIKEIDGQPCYAALRDIPEPIDIVNIFRRSEYLDEVVDEAIQVGAKTVWAQLGISDDRAVQKALAAGLNVAANTCIKIDSIRLLSDAEKCRQCKPVSQ